MTCAYRSRSASLPAVQDPPYAMSIGTSPQVRDQRAVRRVGRDAARRVARASRPSAGWPRGRSRGRRPRRRRRGRAPPSCARSASTVRSRPPRGDPVQHRLVAPRTTPALAEHSVAMLASVARSSGESDASPGPPNSITRSSVVLPPGVVGEDVEHHVLGRDVRAAARPSSSKRIDSGTSTNVKPEQDQRRVLGRTRRRRRARSARRPCRCGCRSPG